MQSLPQHACDGCNELLDDIERMLSRVAAAKRLGTLEEIRIGLSAVQMDFGAVKVQASGLKAHVCAAFATAGPPEVEVQCTRLIPRPVTVPMFPKHCESR